MKQVFLFYHRSTQRLGCRAKAVFPLYGLDIQDAKTMGSWEEAPSERDLVNITRRWLDDNVSGYAYGDTRVILQRVTVSDYDNIDRIF